jgi:diguanylate cyclase (GGDEF)-like protein
MPKTLAVLLAALLLALGSIAAVIHLQSQADASRDAQVRLAHVETDLNALQELPWNADPEEAGPVVVQKQMEAAEQRIEKTLAELRRDSPATDLTKSTAAFRSNLAALERLRGYVARDQGEQAGRWNSMAEDRAEAASRAFRVASVDYEAEASRSLKRARVGSAAVILALLGAFGFFYHRSRKEHLLAEKLAQENERLLAASRQEAITDALTGLRNRRALMDDLAAGLESVDGARQLVCVLFDLDGFKAYNDTFGHPAGDVLLARLADRLRTTLDGIGTAYRMGGDEFCVLATVGEDGSEGIARLAAAALSEDGEGFKIRCSYGAAVLPTEASSPDEALRVADTRMYGQKAGRAPASRQSTDVLLKVLAERSRELEEHISDVAQLAELTAQRLGIPGDALKRIRLAAELHDVGKTAIPDAILNKREKLNDDEWEFIRRHTVIGERIIRAAPSLEPAADLVRSSHERVDGTGYPDRLSGPDIPLGSRIIAVCDAFDAMVSDRPYRVAMSVEEAKAELRRCAGTQFDAEVVEAFLALVEDLGRQGASRSA